MIALSACGAGKLVVTRVPPTATPQPTETAKPPDTPVPTATPTSTATPTPLPTATPTPKPVRFGLILQGPFNDHSGNEAHIVAAEYVKKNLPGSDFVYIDKLNSYDRPAWTVELAVNDLRAKGAKLIFTTSDDFKNDTLTVAQKFPDLTFINIAGDSAWKDGNNFKAPSNLGNFASKLEYGEMIAGCAAALTTQTGKVGYLGPTLNERTRRLANAAYLGAKYCANNFAQKSFADFKFNVKWIGFWYSIPGTTLDATQVANEFYSTGHDVVISGIDTHDALIVAGQRAKRGEKVWAIPFNYKDACAQLPDVCLGVPYLNWSPRYFKTVKAFQDGTLKQSWDWDEPDWKELNNPDTSPLGFTFGKALSVGNRTQLDRFIAGLGNGSLNLWKGPLKLQDGTLYTKDGAIASDKDIWYLPALLDGMTGQSTIAK